MLMNHFLSGLMKFTVASILMVSLMACGGKEERKQAYLEKGKAYLAEKNYEKAKIEFKNVVQIDPKFAEVFYYMGLLEEKNKEFGKALAQYKKAIELDEKYTEPKIKLAKIYVIVGTKKFVSEAKKLLREVEQEDPSNLEAELISITIEYKTADKVKALIDLEALVKKDISLIDGVSLLANIYLNEGKDSKAEKLLTKGVAANNNNIPLRINLAKLHAKNKKYDLAEQYLKEVVSIEPDNFSLHVALGGFYASSNQFDKAEKVFRQSIKDDDEDAKRYLILIEFLLSRVSLEKAIAELDSAIQQKPELYELQFARAALYRKIGKLDKAKKFLKKIIDEKSFDKEGVNARNKLAEILISETNTVEAKKYVDQVLAEYPNDNDALLISGKLALSDFDAISAINGLRTVVKNDPKNAQASLLLAQAHDLNNESALAENELKKALEVNPVNDQVHVNYARYIASKGRTDEALEVIDKALVYFKDSYDLMDIKLKILASQGKESEVISLLDLMEQTNANKAEVNLIKGQYFLRKQKIPRALEQFEKAYQKSQDKFKPLQLIIKTYMADKQPEKALQRLQKNIDANPDDPVANLLLGQVYQSQKKIAEAREKFILASKAAETWLPPYDSLAGSYLNEKNYDKALVVYQDALTKLKNKVSAQIQIAAIYERQKDFPGAMNIYQQILAENSGNIVAANNYASLILDYGKEADFPKALELSKSFKKLPQPAFQDTLGWAYAKSGDNAKAVEILKPVVEKAPKIAVFRYHLGYALYYMGDKAAAKSHLEIAASSEQQFPGKDDAEKLLKSI